MSVVVVDNNNNNNTTTIQDIGLINVDSGTLQLLLTLSVSSITKGYAIKLHGWKKEKKRKKEINNFVVPILM